jgi:hypothetical protein
MKKQDPKLIETKLIETKLIEMAQDTGISGFQIGKKKINIPEPKDSPCKVPKYGGGFVNIQKGDRIKLWYRDNNGKWQSENEGTVISCNLSDGNLHLVFDRIGKYINDGYSSCFLGKGKIGNWERVVEKIKKS